MEGKIVFKGKSKKGKSFLIRYPKKDDVKSLLHFVNTLSKERTFISYQGEQVALELETKYLKDELSAIKDRRNVMLLAFSGDLLVGNTSIKLRERTSKHVGLLSISVAKDFRGEGIGKKLMELVLKEAEENLADLRIVTLGLFACNITGRGMYEKFGFKQYGVLPKGALYRGEYVDYIDMYKNIRE